MKTMLDLNLSVRALNALNALGAKHMTVEEFAKTYSKRDIYNQRNIGAKTTSDLEVALFNEGLTFKNSSKSYYLEELEEEYIRAVHVVTRYHRIVMDKINDVAINTLNTPKYTHATLRRIWDDHHDYNYLEEGKTYAIERWHDDRRRGHEGEWQYFSIRVGGKARKYKPNSGMLEWDFFNLKP